MFYHGFVVCNYWVLLYQQRQFDLNQGKKVSRWWWERKKNMHGVLIHNSPVHLDLKMTWSCRFFKKAKKITSGGLIQTMTTKSSFEINWPLTSPMHITVNNQIYLVTLRPTQLTQVSFLQKNQMLQNGFMISVTLRWHSGVKNHEIWTFKVNFLCQKTSESV